MIKSYLGKAPRLDSSVFIAENAAVIGDVELCPNVNIWYGVTIRADINRVRIGRDTNIQENSVVHVDSPKGDSGAGATIIGERVTIGHGAIIHACEIEDECLIGMGAIVLSGAKIGQGSLIAAGAVVREGQVIPPRSLVVGIPAVVKGTVPEEKIGQIRESARHYVLLANNHRSA